MMFIPVAGWFVAVGLERLRFDEVLDPAHEMVKTRPEGLIELTWASERQKRIARFLAINLEREFGWPAQKLFAEDQLCILCLNDDFQLQVIARRLAKEFALSISALYATFGDLMGRGTIRQLVLRVESMVAQTASD